MSTTETSRCGHQYDGADAELLGASCTLPAGHPGMHQRDSLTVWVGAEGIRRDGSRPHAASNACLDIAELDGNAANLMLGYLAGRMVFQGQLSAQDWGQALDAARASMARTNELHQARAARRREGAAAQATAMDRAWANVRPCKECDGRGVFYDCGHPYDCSGCKGSGYLEQQALGAWEQADQ